MLPITDHLERETIIALLEALPVAALYIEEDHVHLNHRAETLTGFRKMEIQTLDDWFRKLHGNAHGTARRDYEADRAAGFPAPRHSIITGRDGRRRHVEVTAAGSERIVCVMHDITDLTAMNDQNQESTVQYQAIKSTSMEGFAIIDDEGKLHEVNDLYCSILGYSRDELLAMSIKDIEAMKSPQETRKHMRKVAEAGSGRFETRHRRKDGSIIAVEISTTYLPATKRFISLVRDITDLKKKEESLKESEESFRLAMEATSVGLWDWRPATDTVYFSPGYYRMLGYEPGDFPMTADIWRELLHPEDRDRTLAINMDCIEGKIPSFQVEFRMQAKDGGWRWVLGRGSAVSRDDNGKAIRLIGTHVDITDLKRTQEALRQSEERYRRFSALTSDYVHFCIRRGDGPYNVKWIGGAVEAITGYSEQEIFELGCWLPIVHPDDREEVGETYKRLTPGECCVHEFRLIARDGTVRWIRQNCRCEAGSLPDELWLYGASQDITERKEAELALTRLNEELDRRVADRTARMEMAMREHEAFSYSVSHDLRAPLRHINSYSTIVTEEFGDQIPPEAHRYLDRIAAASKHLGQLIDDLLELSRVGRVELNTATVHLSELAAMTAASLRETGPRRTVEWIIAKGLKAKGDATLLRQLLQNLLGNAWKYTSKEPKARIEFGKTVVAGQEAFFVRDNGVGFDMTFKDKLFGHFQRLHGSEFEGTGIGLATVKRIIERHGGAVWAEGRVGEGATFYFTLPGS